MALAKVLIPVVVLPNREQPQRETRLWEVWGRPATPSEQAREWLASLDDKRVHPTVYPLGQFKRYDSGVKGLWAVKRLLGVGNVVNDLETTLREIRLDSGDGAAWVGRIEEHSSDLGLGLALLMEVMGTSERLLAATGELGDTQDCGVEDDVPVKPVRDVPEKLRALLEKKRSGGRFEALKIVFTPCHYYTPEGGLELVEWMDVTRELHEEGIQVCPVSTFGEAAKCLGVDATALETTRLETQARIERRRKLARSGRTAGSMLLGLGLGAVGFLLYGLSGQVDLAWEPAFATADPQPFVACAGKDGSLDANRAIHKESFTPVVPVGSRLSWRVRIGNPVETKGWDYRLASLLGYEGYHLALVMLGKSTGLGAESVIVPKLSERSDTVQRIHPGQIWDYGWNLDTEPESSLLLILVNRRHAFDVADLRNGLNDLSRRPGDPAPGKPAFSAALDYARKHADGVIAFGFETRVSASACPSQPTRFDCPQAQIESQPRQGSSISFLDALADPGWRHYAFATDHAGRTRLPLKQETTPGYFQLPLPSGLIYVVAAREDISGLAGFSIDLPIERGDMDEGKGVTFLHGPTPQRLQTVAMGGLPSGARACSLRW